MNLTDKARRGSQEAMEALFDMTKNDAAYLCRLLLGDNQAASVAVPRIYRSLWEQVLAGRITTEEDFAQAALVKTAAFCKTVLAKKDSKSFRIPQNRDFVLGMGEGRLSLQGEPWELAVDNLPPLHRFLYVLPVLCGYTQAQLAKLFHTNEETVRLAQVAEAICLKRLFAALSRLLGRSCPSRPRSSTGLWRQTVPGPRCRPRWTMLSSTPSGLCAGPSKGAWRKSGSAWPWPLAP